MNDLLLSPILSNGIVIQRDSAFPVWSRKKAAVSFLGKTYESRQTDSKWLVTLEPAQAGGPFTMNIVSDEDSIIIQDIYIGDLWLCGGQSNMEMQMSRLIDDFGEEWETAAHYSHIRQFKAPQECDFSGVRENLSGGRWTAASGETLHEFSAVSWFFAKKMYEKYRIPIGLVNTAWGGTTVESWMSRDALADFPAKIADGEQYANPARCKETADKTDEAIQKWEDNLLREDLGLINNWKNPCLDISGWNEITLPGNFSNAGLERFCGVIWLVKEFDITAEFASQNAKIWLGTIVDADTVYINGAEAGNTCYRYPPRKYVPAGLLRQGKNRIVIRVTCNNGEGGITCDKPFRIFTDNETVELAGNWKYKTGVTACTRPQEFFFQRQPMGNFNAMIAPVLKFPLKGVIWYQGESNESYPHDYAKLFSCLITDWRKKNGNKKLPFLFIQLPVFGVPSDNDENSPWAIIREAQKSVLSVPFTGMAAALEFGEWNDLHPINKKDIGERLFLSAEKTLFSAGNTSPGPILRAFNNEKGTKINKLYLYFNNCGTGLKTHTIPSSSPRSYGPFQEINLKDIFLSVTGSEGQMRLPAEIEKPDVISIDISSVKNPKKVLYAWANNPRDRQLYNSDGLPAIPFKIELEPEKTNV